MSNPCSNLLELLGMLVGIVAWFCSFAATIMPSWVSLSTELFVMESYDVGLWENCVVQEGFGIECRPFETLLGLSLNLTLARFCMCLSDALSLLGLLFAIPGLDMVKCCDGSQGRKVKRGMKIAAGVMILMSGILVLYPVSNIAHQTVMKFFDHSISHAVPRSEFGNALFIGWAAGLFHAVSATLFFTSCCCSEENEMHVAYHHQEKFKPVSSSDKKYVEYV